MDRWYVGAGIYFITVIGPYLLEQAAYTRYTPRPTGQAETKAAIGYRWEYVWDAAHLIVLLHAGYKLIFRTASLDVWDGVGIAVFIAGVAMRIWSLRSLGEFYDSGVMVKDNHQIVRRGPYRVLRHPLHIGTDLQIGGLALLTPWWLGVPIVIISLLFTVYRNRIEEKVMTQHLGQTYTDYLRATWDVIDLIYWKPRI